MQGLTGGRPAPLLLLCAAALAIQTGCERTPESSVKSAVPSQPAVELTAANFRDEVLDSKQPVMVDFWAPWCGPCIMFGPTLEELAAEFDGRAVVARLNVDDEPELADRYEISGIPTVLIFKDGKVVERYRGGERKEILTLRLEELMAIESPEESFDEGDQPVDNADSNHGRRRGTSGKGD